MTKKEIDRPTSSLVTTAISLALVLHLFVIFVTLTSNFQISPLQDRVLGLLRPYSQPLNLELDFTPFYLTHGSTEDVDHRVEYRTDGLAEGESWRRMGGTLGRATESAMRFDRWARMAANFASEEDEQVPAELAEAAARYLIARHGETPTRIRIRRQLLQTMDAVNGADLDAQRDPRHESYAQTVYEANVLVDGQGQVIVAKVAGRGESAQPSGSSGATP